MINFRFPILFASDNKYIPHLATSLYSLLTNNQNLLIEIFVFISQISNNDKQKLEKICAKFKTPLVFISLNDNFFKGLPIHQHFTKAIYYRLFAPSFVQGNKCLYLDADTIVNGSIKELIELDLRDYYLAAVEESTNLELHKQALGMRPNSCYFNSGVMLLNLNKWRNTNLKDLVIACIRENSHVILYPEQDALNLIVKNNWAKLDAKYNFQTSMLKEEKYSYLSNGMKSIIVHFTTSEKPSNMNNNHPCKNLYWFYRNNTPYKFFYDDISFKNLVRFLLVVPFKRLIKKFIN